MIEQVVELVDFHAAGAIGFTRVNRKIGTVKGRANPRKTEASQIGFAVAVVGVRINPHGLTGAICA